MENLLVNSIDLDQTTHYVASDGSLHCLPITPLRFTLCTMNMKETMTKRLHKAYGASNK